MFLLKKNGAETRGRKRNETKSWEKMGLKLSLYSLFFSNSRRKPERQTSPREVVRLRREHFYEVHLEVADTRGPDETSTLFVICGGLCVRVYGFWEGVGENSIFFFFFLSKTK